MMSRKDYERAAKIVRDTCGLYHGTTDSCEASIVREAFVAFFQGENPRFDADRFRSACEVKS